MTTPRTMLITGGTRGVGQALVDCYVTEGYIVRACARGTGTDYQCDITKGEEVGRMLRDIGEVDILINCAGMASMNHLLLTPTETMERVIRTNLLGAMVMCREVGKRMIRGRGGSIVNVSTVAVPLSLEGEAAYVASKAGVESLTRVAAKEMAMYGVTVNCVGPTIVVGRDGEPTAPIGLASGLSMEKVEGLLEKTALKKPCAVEDIKNVIDFFISSRSLMVTGQVVYLGGV